MSGEANAYNSTNPLQLWKDWHETTARMWLSPLACMEEVSGASLGLYNFWMKNAREAQRQLMNSIIDPVEMWKQWTYAVSDVWRVAIETSTGAVGAFYRGNEELFQDLQLPTRSDFVRLEGHIVSLEERIYTIEDALIYFEDGYLKATTDQVVEVLVERLERAEDKLNTFDLPSSSTFQQTEMLEDLAGRLERVEDKLNILLAALEKIEARAYPEAIASADGSEVLHKNTKEA